MTQIPDEPRYTDEHEWALEGKGLLVIGITDHAQEALGEIVYVELPSEGDEIAKGDSFGAVESTKAVSDLYAPVKGEIIEVNEALFNSPEIINEDPYGEGWLIKVRPHDPTELDDLMDHEDYAEFLEKDIG